MYAKCKMNSNNIALEFFKRFGTNYECYCTTLFCIRLSWCNLFKRVKVDRFLDKNGHFVCIPMNSCSDPSKIFVINDIQYVVTSVFFTPKHALTHHNNNTDYIVYTFGKNKRLHRERESSNLSLSLSQLYLKSYMAYFSKL